MSELKDILETAFKMFGAITGPPTVPIAKTEVDGLTVSTVFTHDMGHETAICDAHCHPVERYADEAAAKVGHARWVEFVKSGQRRITKLGYGVVSEETVELSPYQI